ncbi:hypothetical protein F4802DRAFT_606591 [Xylaria palmicola]|nr:hypothetical protein F4802DRAFT_606591 [Xylaria palmicola]
MEAAGLAIGVAGLAGLFSSCIDIVERWDSYKDSVTESASLRARLAADRIRFQQWGQSVGIGNGGFEENHHRALDNPSIRSAVDLILQSIKKIDEDANRLAPHLGHFSTKADKLSNVNRERSQFTKLEPSTRKSRIGWAVRDKGRATMLVVSFEALVQKLHDLIPTSGTAEGTGVEGAEGGNVTSVEEGKTPWSIDAQKVLVELEKHIHNEVRKYLIDWLDTPETKGTYRDRIQRRLEGTCDWILDRREFQKWRSENPKTLWINGPPGYGKTILTARIIQHLSLDQEISLAYFFSSSETNNCTDPFIVVRAWLSQLIIQSQHGFDLAREMWETSNERIASQADVEELFSAIVQNVPRCALVIDGLDEFDTAHSSPVSEFLNYLTDLILKFKARLLVVSRNELAIREGLRVDSDEMKEQLVELQIVPNDVEADAIMFSQNAVNKKLANKTEADREELSKRLVDRCDSMFLGIKLLEDDLRGGKNLKQLRRVIDEAPNKLNHIYDRNWERIKSLEKSSRHRAFSILRWAAFGQRPLTVLEITEALLLGDGEYEDLDYEELPDSVDPDYIRTEILDLCASLVEIRPGSTSDLGNSTVHLTHFSVKQYIICHMSTYPTELMANEQLRSLNEDIQNNIIAKICLRYLNYERTWGKMQPEDNVNTAIQAFRVYATHSWKLHMKSNVDNTLDVIQLTNAFFRPTNQNWQSWRKEIDSIRRHVPIEYNGRIETGNPLFYASLYSLMDTVEYLIHEEGLDVNYVDSSNRTALLAVSSKKANTDIASDRGATPLHASAFYGHAEIVEKLLQEGADLTLVTREGLTPLHLASARGHVQVVKSLLEQEEPIPQFPAKKGRHRYIMLHGKATLK